MLTVVYSRRMSPLMTRAQQLRGEVSGIAHESFDGALVVKTLGREADETARFRAAAHELRDTNIAVGRVRGLFDPVMEALPTLGVLVVLLVGTARVGSGDIGAGELVQVAYLFTLLAFPVRAIGWVLNELPRSVVGWDRVQRVLTAQGEQAHGSARLPGRRRRRAAGRRRGVRLRRRTGAARRVLLRRRRPDGRRRRADRLGQVLAGHAAGPPRRPRPRPGGVRRRGPARARARRHSPEVAALVPQTAFLFDDTVRGNLTLGADLSDEQVWAALRTAQADGFVAALPAGLDTVVGERGHDAVRRAAAAPRAGPGRRAPAAAAGARRRHERRRPARSSSASSTGCATAPSTVVVVAYRRATIELADEVVFVQDGRVADRGSSAELAVRSPGYRDLVTAYARAEAERQALESDAEAVA